MTINVKLHIQLMLQKLITHKNHFIKYLCIYNPSSYCYITGIRLVISIYMQ